MNRPSTGIGNFTDLFRIHLDSGIITTNFIHPPGVNPSLCPKEKGNNRNLI